MAALAIGLDWLPSRLSDLLSAKPLAFGDWADGTWAIRSGVQIMLLILSWARTLLITRVALLEPRERISPHAMVRALMALPVALPVLIWTGGLTYALMAGQVVIAFGISGDPRIVQNSIFFAIAVASIYLALVVLVGVFVPTALAERHGFVATFRRSVSLMRGNRLVFVGMYIALQIIGGVVSLPTQGSFERIRHTPGLPRVVAEAPEWTLQLVMSLLFAVWLTLVAACYRDLRRILDGEVDQIAETFA